MAVSLALCGRRRTRDCPTISFVFCPSGENCDKRPTAVLTRPILLLVKSLQEQDGAPACVGLIALVPIAARRASRCGAYHQLLSGARKPVPVRVDSSTTWRVVRSNMHDHGVY